MCLLKVSKQKHLKFNKSFKTNSWFEINIVIIVIMLIFVALKRWLFELNETLA